MDLKKINSVTVILQKTTGDVLLCKRSDAVSFFRNFWVFPGGKVENQLSDPWEGTEEAVLETISQELYEEIGFLPGDPHPIPPEKRSKRHYDNSIDFSKRREFLDSLSFVGRRQTPPFTTIIFDTAYFYRKSEMVDNLEVVVDGSELVEYLWIKPIDALNMWENQELHLPPPVVHTLSNLALNPLNFEIISLVETDLPIGLQTKIQFAPGIQLIPFQSNTIPPFHHTNLGLVISEGECTIIDPGAKSEDHLIAILNSLPSTPKIIITHDHKDHWEGLDICAKIFSKAKVYCHELTLSRIKTDLEKIAINSGAIPVGKKTLQIIHSPGHTDGHIAIYDNESRILFAGDHVVGIGSAVLSPTTGDMADYLATTEKLLKLNSRILLPAHGPPIFTPEKILKHYIKHRLERESNIQKAVEAGNHTLADIVKVVYADVPEEMWEYAKANIRLHLRKLQAEKNIPTDISFN